MMYSVQRLEEKRLAVVLVGNRDINEPRATVLIRHIEKVLDLPVMLVCRDAESFTGVRAKAHFDPYPAVYSLLESRDIDWMPLPGAFGSN